VQTSIAAGISRKWTPLLARTGLVAKGIIYCLIGAIAFMAAFEIGGQSESNTNKEGILTFIQRLFAGEILLALLVIGLLCYSFWRGVQCFTDTENKGTKTKGIAVRSRYLLSGLIYLSFAIAAIRHLLHESSDSGDGNQEFIGQLLAKPFGQYFVATAALIIAGVGIYQIVYGISGKYKKHVSGLQLGTDAATFLVKSGLVGYTARGIVWLIISWLIFKAAIHANSNDAGDTNEAFSFLDASYGSFLTGLLGLGLVLYGIFNFIRARFEHFRT
jgi:hypothetical protein